MEEQAQGLSQVVMIETEGVEDYLGGFKEIEVMEAEGLVSKRRENLSPKKCRKWKASARGRKRYV